MATFKGWPDSRRDPAPMQGMAGWPEVGNLAGAPNIARRLNRRHPINTGLVGWWPLDEGAGTRIRDLSVYGNHGTLTNAADPATATSGWGAGASQKELAFDGVNDHVSIPDAAQLRLLSSMSVCFWMRPQNRSNYYMPIGKSTADIAYPYVVMQFYPDGLIWFSRGNGASEVQLTSATAPPVNIWTHVCIVHNGATSTTFYYNGAVDAVRAGFSNSITDGGSPLYIARRGSGYHYPGGLRHLRLYSRALAAAEVQQICADSWIGAY